MRSFYQKAQQGLAALKEGNPQAALACFEAALSLGDVSAETLWLRAVALMQLGRFRESLAAARDCLQRHLGYEPALELIDHLEESIAQASQSTRTASGAASSAPLQSHWKIGDAISGRWEVFGWAEGGMGRVYFVRDRAWSRTPLALKTLLERQDLNPRQKERARERFLREAQVWLDLGAHPHIVSGYYTLEVEGALRFFMEYVPGQPLDRVLQKSAGPLPLSEGLDLLLQLSSGMEYVHARGVVHRDLKPHNCLLMADGTLRVTDFGLSKAFNEEDLLGAPLASSRLSYGTRLSRQGAGTAEYMPPEQWEGLGQAAGPADVYSFGVMAYEILAGSRPFDTHASLRKRYLSRAPDELTRLLEAEDPAPELREKIIELFHRRVAPLPLSDFGARVPEELEVLALCCLEKEPARRPSFSELRQKLGEIYQKTFQKPYPRELPGALSPSEAGENNRAISYYVMGQTEKATRILDDWLAHNPTALYPWLNRQSIALQEGEYDLSTVEEKLAALIQPVHARAIESDPEVFAFCARVRRGKLIHDEPVQSAVFSPDAETILSASGELAWLWKVNSGERRALSGHSGNILAVALSRDGKLALTAGEDRTARLWDVERGVLLRMILTGDSRVKSASFSPDGKHALLGGRAVQLWEIARGKLVRSFEGEGAAAFSPDGRFILARGKDNTPRLWEAESGKLVRRLKGQQGARSAAAFSPAGDLICLADPEHALGLWEVKSGRQKERLSGPTGVITSLAISPDGRFLLSGNEDGQAFLQDLHDGAHLRCFSGHSQAITAVAISPDGRFFLTAGLDGLVRLRETKPSDWPLLLQRATSPLERLRRAGERDDLLRRLSLLDASAYAHLQAFRQKHPEYQRDEEILEATYRFGIRMGLCVGLRDVFCVRTFPLQSQINGVAFSPDSQSILLATQSGKILNIGVKDGEIQHVLSGHTGPVTCLALSRDGRLLLSGSKDKTARLWDVSEQRVLSLYQGHALAVTSVALSPCGEYALTSSDELKLRLFRLSDGACQVIEAPSVVASVAISPDGRFWLTGGNDEAAYLWDAASQRPLRTLRGHRCIVRAVAFSPDGRAFLSGSANGARLFGAWPGSPPLRLEGHTRRVISLAPSPGGRFLLTGSKDKSARLWDIYNGRQARILEGHRESIRAVAFSPDGRLLVTGSEDQTVRLWFLDADWVFLEDLLPEAEALLQTQGTSSLWPQISRADLDSWLDVWCDLARCASHADLSPELRERFFLFRQKFLDFLTSFVKHAPAFPPEDKAELLGHPLYHVGLVDPSLAADLGYRMGIEPGVVLGFGWPGGR